jgi:hypothetical protein
MEVKDHRLLEYDTVQFGKQAPVYHALLWDIDQVGWQFRADVSVQDIGSIFKQQRWINPNLGLLDS